MNTTREVVAPAMRAAAEDMCGGDAERIFSSDTRDLMAFFVTLRKLLHEVRVPSRWSQVGSATTRATEADECSVVSMTSHFRTCISLRMAALSRYSRT
jgi:hypothetical protein